MQLSCSKDWTSLNWAFTPGPWSKKHQPPVAVDRKRNHDGLSFWPRTQSLECQFQKEEHCIEPWQTNNLQNIWMFVRTKWWNCSCSCWHNQSSPIFVSSAPGHSPLSLGTGHSWPHIFHQKKNIKSAERKAPSFPFKVPCFFSGCFWHCVCLDFVDGNQTLVSHDQRHTDSWDFQRGSPSDCWKMQIHNRNHSYNHHLNIHLFDDLFDVLFHVMDIWSEIYHLGYCHLQLLFTNSQVLKLFNGRCSTCIWQTTWSITSALWRTLCSCKKMAQTSIHDTSLNVYDASYYMMMFDVSIL